MASLASLGSKVPTSWATTSGAKWGEAPGDFDPGGGGPAGCLAGVLGPRGPGPASCSATPETPISDPFWPTPAELACFIPADPHTRRRVRSLVGSCRLGRPGGPASQHFPPPAGDLQTQNPKGCRLASKWKTTDRKLKEELKKNACPNGTESATRQDQTSGFSVLGSGARKKTDALRGWWWAKKV